MKISAENGWSLKTRAPIALLLCEGRNRCNVPPLSGEVDLLPSTDSSQQLRAIADLLDQALALAESADEALVAALVSGAHDAVERRYRELAKQ